MKRYTYPILLILFWSTILVYIFISSVPIPSNESYKTKTTIFNFIPQGWGFFTRDPRENEISLFYISEDTIKSFTETNGNRNNFYGASRRNRLISIELGLLSTKINDTSWTDMKGEKLILDKKKITDTIVNTFKPINIVGDFFIVNQERVPWAWSKNSESIIMPYKYVKIHVKAN